MINPEVEAIIKDHFDSLLVALAEDDAEGPEEIITPIEPTAAPTATDLLAQFTAKLQELLPIISAFKKLQAVDEETP